jgi:hypothetical protein
MRGLAPAGHWPAASGGCHYLVLPVVALALPVAVLPQIISAKLLGFFFVASWVPI